jgi:hypothetical protein
VLCDGCGDDGVERTAHFGEGDADSESQLKNKAKITDNSLALNQLLMRVF